MSDAGKMTALTVRGFVLNRHHTSSKLQTTTAIAPATPVATIIDNHGVTGAAAVVLSTGRSTLSCTETVEMAWTGKLPVAAESLLGDDVKLVAAAMMLAVRFDAPSTVGST